MLIFIRGVVHTPSRLFPGKQKLSVFNAAPLLFGPFASIIAKRFGFRATTIGGGIIAAIGIYASVFANSLGILVLTYGCIAGFGISLA